MRSPLWKESLAWAWPATYWQLLTAACARATEPTTYVAVFWRAHYSAQKGEVTGISTINVPQHRDFWVRQPLAESPSHPALGRPSPSAP